MAATIPTTEPDSLRAGDTWQWRRDDLSDYPASTWSLVYHFRNADQYFDVNAGADADAFLISVPAATTATRTPGRYTWYAMVTDGTDRFNVDEGSVELLADVSAAAAYDGRNWSRRMLDYVEAALESRASADQLDLINATLADEGYTRDREGLIRLRSALEIEVKRTEKGVGALRRIVTRFNN